MNNYLNKTRLVVALISLASLSPSTNLLADDDCVADPSSTDANGAPRCLRLDPITIFGSAGDARDVAGGASYITNEDLQEFETTDVVRALRRVPGVSLQVEDGWALRPNISIRGSATERSSRITLLEDNVLIAPAPYAASSAYYFPTFGRINSVEVLKGPSSITQGPYTVGGAINLVTTPIPAERGGMVRGEIGSDSTWRAHAWYGDSQERFAYLVETHQWQSDGYQSIDNSASDTGLDKADYLAKLAFYSDPTAAVYQRFDIKLQTSDETSEQSYLGLTDADFENDPLRRYGASRVDEMNNDHDQVVLNWRVETESGLGATLTAYSNDTSRAWYKTEAIDFDGSASPETFSGTGWSNVVSAVNLGDSLGGLSPAELQAILGGADTAEGSIQVRNNARTYESRGIQLALDHVFSGGETTHTFQAGVRYHEDEEDRLQRNDTYQQLGGELVLNQVGLEGNAGNRIQSAEAWAFYVFDRIDWGTWTLTPGLRYESIDLSRVRYYENSDDPSSRDQDNFRDTRSNDVDVWLPGMGAIKQFGDDWQMVMGVHKGFAVPGNAPGVDPEESINYEYGVRHVGQFGSFEAMGFFNDYSNLVGVCTNSSGSDCDPGDAFNGDAVHVLGLELSWNSAFPLENGWSIPLEVAYTWMDAEFETAFDSEFFGNVEEGDPVPYIPDNQFWLATGLDAGDWSFDASVNFVDGTCTAASCGAFESTESATLIDLAAHYRWNERLELYGVVENATDKLYIAGRQPYGARTNKPRTFILGARVLF